MVYTESAQAVVIGGGVGGASIAYHLARNGWKDVLVLEQHELTEGTTWHSAGFVGQLRSTISQTRMIMYSSELYAELERETGRDPGWRGVGGIRVATSPARVEELRRQASAATTYGLHMDLLSPAETHDRLPILNVDDVLEAAWMPGDGYLDPELLVGALAEGARQKGVEFRTQTKVVGLDVTGGRVTGVATADGARIAAETVVVAAGAATGVVAALAGAVVPIVPMRHQYVVTEAFAPIDEHVPTVRDPDHITYFRPENGGLLVGGYSRRPVTDDADEPLATARTLFDSDMERFDESWRGAVNRVPALADVELVKVVNGPEAFTPDGEFILGETEVRGLWVAAGFCVHGLAGAGGVGKVLAEWIVDGHPEYDMASMDVRRFGGHYRSKRLAKVKALDAYSRYYDIVYPHEERDAGRPLRVSPAYPRLREAGAAFGEKSMWERVNWFEPNADAGDASERPAGWAGKFWSPAIAAECVATRDAAGLFDQSSFSKLEVHGPGAAAALNRIAANDVDRPVGSAVYTQLLNERGGIEADLTITRLAEDRFRIVTGTAFGRHDGAWIARHLPPDVVLEDVTAQYACYCLWGPRARDILQPLCDDDLSHAAFGFLKARPITVGTVPVFAQRITFVGELGWELYTPAEYGLALWDLLWEAGAEHGMRGGGYRAIDSMRLEKGYRVWGADITPITDPFSAGLGFAVQLEKPVDFVGRQALIDAGEPTERLRCMVVDDPRAVCLGNEPVRIDGTPRGRVTSGGFGHRIGKSIAYAYLPAELGPGARVELGIFGEWVGADVVQDPLYDPKYERVRA